MSRSDRTHIFIATPCYGGMVSQLYMQSVLALSAEAPAARLSLTIGLLGQDALITRSRNTLLAQFMTTDATHVLFVDADIGFSPCEVARLIGAERDVVGALYPLRASHWGQAASRRIAQGESHETACLDYVGQPGMIVDENGFSEGLYAGTGFLLISRSAVTRMVAGFPDTRCRHGHVLGGSDAEIYALFDCLIDPVTRFYLSEDYAFCARWRALGGKIWLDTRAKLTHCGMSEFRGDFQHRFSAG